MAFRTPSPSLSPHLRDWLRPHLRWITVPSWIASLIMHVLVGGLVLSLAQLSSCRHDIAGNDGDSFREVGIRLRPAPEESSRESSQPEAQSSAESTSPSPNRDLPPSMVSSLPPVPLQLPEVPKPLAVIGAGSLPQLSAVDVDHLVRPMTPSSGGGAAAGGTPSGGTSFLGVQDVGKRFVYVIDRSFSMANDHALQAAKAELLASLQRLDETQQFQVIFYNNEYVVMDTRGGRFDVFSGTDAQRMKVAEQIREVSPAGGTRHLPAILEGLKFNPDVLFLLTDGAAESALDHRDLEEIRRHNRHGARIHCIEFGRSSKSLLGEAGNFLKELSRENDGKYVYRNVSGGV